MSNEFIIDDHRITVYEKGVEIEEFDSNDNFVSRIFMKHSVFIRLIENVKKIRRVKK